MNYMCRNCRTIFKAPWATKFPTLCPACQPKPKKKPKPPPTDNAESQRSEKAPPSPNKRK